MSSLDFLSPDRARSDLGFSPVAKSSMERRQREAGATFEERDGWLVAVSLPNEQPHLRHAGIVDLSHLAKVEVTGRVPSPVVGETLRHVITKDKAIVLSPTGQGTAVRARLAEAGAGVLDVTGALSAFAVIGPEAPAVMRRLTQLHSFPASGDVSHVTAHVLLYPGGYLIVFPQEYGHYLWEVAVDAAEQLGGGPAGVDAIEGGGR
jgi:glycine cleavage system aminomethyltransferase T